MEKLFGIPIGQLLVILLAIFGAGMALMVLVALRNRVMFRLALRNAHRHRSQTTLIVLGLALATVLFSAAFTAGDTLSHSIRVLALRDLGEVDVGVKVENREASGRPLYFDQAVFETVHGRAGYDYSLDYGRADEPPLSGEDAAWVSSLIQKLQ